LKLKDLVREIHRRSLWQVLGIYLGASWVIFQGIQAIVEGLKLPDWIPGFAVVLLLIGLPVVLATAFVQEGVRPRESTTAGGDQGERGDAGSDRARSASELDSLDGVETLFTWRNAILGGVGAFALLGLMAVGWLLIRGVPSELVEAKASDPIRSIAVLPLVNLSQDPKQEYFADGMTEALITDLAKIGKLRVISRTSIMGYKGTDQPLPQIARELGVDAILEGSVIRDENRFRITVQLINARDDSHLWAENYDRELTGVLALQSAVARAVAEQIEIELTPAEERQLTTSKKIDPAAYESYLRGRFAWNRRTADSYEEAIKHFKDAVAHDPNFALGHAGLALVYDQQGAFGIISPRETTRRIRDAVTRALELDPNLGEAYVSLADLYWWQGRMGEADKSLRRALEINPSYATGHAWMAYLHCVFGRVDEAIRSIETARELDPLSAAFRGDAAQIYFFARRFDEAIEHARASIALDPELAVNHAVASIIYSHLNQHPEAIAAGREGMRLSGGSYYATGWLAYSLARAGEKEQAKRLVLDLVEQSQRRYVDATYIAVAYAGLGDHDELLSWLERGFREGSLWVTLIGRNPVYDRVRSTPRFEAIIDGIDLAG
jgi:TolB-like protein/Flp pilus assembly protein TadD